MNPILVRQRLIEVLVSIQADSGLPCPPIVGTMQPAEELEKFDSKMWPVATGMLATALGVEIALNINIFRVKGTKTAMTIDETIALICSLAKVRIAA